MNREFLQLAQTFDPQKHSVGGWYVSTKLDGMRALWDGGFTRGMACADIPFANVDKHARYVEERISTGLWSRYGQPIYAPNWWLDSLPHIILDGELYAGRGHFQYVTSTVKQLHPVDSDWKKIQYFVFDSPPIGRVLEDGRCNNTNFKKQFKGFYNWYRNHPNKNAITVIEGDMMFIDTYNFLIRQLHSLEFCKLHLQIQLQLSQDKAIQEIENFLELETNLGGEGLMLRKRESYWEPKRTYNLLKVKKYLDSEATVMGYITGRQTDKGSKLLGLMGAMIVDWHGKRFELSGFTDQERELSKSTTHDAATDAAFAWACGNPEKEVPSWIESPHFKRGTKVTFKYRELTDDGIPKEARYWRKV